MYSSPRDSIYATPTRQDSSEIYSEPVLHDAAPRPRAQPQVPLYKKMGRRASEGSMLSDKETQLGSITKDNMNTTMRSVAKAHFLGDPLSHKSLEMPGLNYPNSVGCRLSLDAGRRESSSSLSSSIADGSKDSLSSSNSTSTLTGQDTDDSIILNRIRKSFQQKEEFLRRPSNTSECSPIQREFYSRPKKLDKPVWPPVDVIRQDSPSRSTKPTHQNFQRVKNDIESERDMVVQPGNDNKYQENNRINGKKQQDQSINGSRMQENANHLAKIQENPTACTEFSDSNGDGEHNYSDDKRYVFNIFIIGDFT